ncbi:MAG: hypothetical protein LBL91_00820 [Lachnospiraceae bacterium]|jgi:hypothetical protein|nr:hypothetical protein [Lachnospiraceae bacterium]
MADTSQSNPVSENSEAIVTSVPQDASVAETSPIELEHFTLEELGLSSPKDAPFPGITHKEIVPKGASRGIISSKITGSDYNHYKFFKD